MVFCGMVNPSTFSTSKEGRVYLSVKEDGLPHDHITCITCLTNRNGIYHSSGNALARTFFPGLPHPACFRVAPPVNWHYQGSYNPSLLNSQHSTCARSFHPPIPSMDSDNACLTTNSCMEMGRKLRIQNMMSPLPHSTALRVSTTCPWDHRGCSTPLRLKPGFCVLWGRVRDDQGDSWHHRRDHRTGLKVYCRRLAVIDEDSVRRVDRCRVTNSEQQTDVYFLRRGLCSHQRRSWFVIVDGLRGIDHIPTDRSPQ